MQERAAERDPALLTHHLQCTRVRTAARDCDLRVRLLVRLHVEPDTVLRLGLRQLQGVELAAVLERFALPYLEHQVDALRHPLAVCVLVLVDIEKLRIDGRAARSDAHVDAASRHVVELRDAMREVRRIVEVSQRHPGAESHLLGDSQRPRDEQLRRRHVLPRQQEVLPHPRLRVPEPVGILHQLQVFLVCVRVEPIRIVQRHEEQSEFQVASPIYGRRRASHPIAAQS